MRLHFSLVATGHELHASKNRSTPIPVFVYFVSFFYLTVRFAYMICFGIMCAIVTLSLKATYYLPSVAPLPRDWNRRSGQPL